MLYRKLDKNNDYVFGSGLLNFWQDVPDAVAQAVLTRLRLWSGEWFLNVTEGTPYQAGALGKHQLQSVDPMIRDRILSTEGVNSIANYSSNLNSVTRQLTVNATINTIYGQATIQAVM